MQPNNQQPTLPPINPADNQPQQPAVFGSGSGESAAAPQNAQPAPVDQQFVPPQNTQQPQAPQKPETDDAKSSETKQVSRTTTQNSLLLSEIRENMVIMGDGSFRAVIACKSINFDLMSDREREAVEYSYQNFLNSLYFPAQIFVRSQRVDIGPYLDKLEKIRRGQDNMLLNVLMDDYINFIDALAEEANIMDKSFFVIVPYFPTGDLSNIKEQGKGILGKMFPKQNTSQITKINQEMYTKAKDEIKNRVDSVMSGLFQIGVKAVQLNTKELGEMFYNMYNPDTAVREPLGDFERITSTYVKKGDGQADRPNISGGPM